MKWELLAKKNASQLTINTNTCLLWVHVFCAYLRMHLCMHVCARACNDMHVYMQIFTKF